MRNILLFFQSGIKINKIKNKKWGYQELKGLRPRSRGSPARTENVSFVLHVSLLNNVNSRAKVSLPAARSRSGRGAWFFNRLADFQRSGGASANIWRCAVRKCEREKRKKKKKNTHRKNGYTRNRLKESPLVCGQIFAPVVCSECGKHPWSYPDSPTLYRARAPPSSAKLRGILLGNLRYFFNNIRARSQARCRCAPGRGFSVRLLAVRSTRSDDLTDPWNANLYLG